MVCIIDTFHLIGLTSIAIIILYFVGFKLSMKHIVWRLTIAWCLALITNVVMQTTLENVWPDDILSQLVASIAFSGFFYSLLSTVQSLLLLITGIVMLKPVQTGAVVLTREIIYDLFGVIIETWTCYLLMVFALCIVLAIYVLMYRYRVIQIITQGICFGGLFTLAIRISYTQGLPVITELRALCCRFLAADLYSALTANIENLQLLSDAEDKQCVLRSDAIWWLMFIVMTIVQIIGHTTWGPKINKIEKVSTPIPIPKHTHKHINYTPVTSK